MTFASDIIYCSGSFTTERGYSGEYASSAIIVRGPVPVRGIVVRIFLLGVYMTSVGLIISVVT